MSNQSALHYEQGKLCYQNKKFQEAIFQFSEAIRLKPDTPQAAARCYNARGVVHFYLGEFRKVIKDCTQALNLDPNNANYHNCRGNAYFSLGKFHKAAEDFSKAIELSPEASHGRYYNNRGSAYRRLKQFKEAIEDYTAAIAVDPKNGNYYNNRGNTYFDMGDFQLAIEDFTTALGLEPYSPKTRLTLAQAQEALAQEKRMKNATQFKGVFSSIKSKSSGNKVKSERKEREAGIYVSPAGVEVTFHRGVFKRKCQQSFQWTEDMKIELLDDTHVKLFLDSSRNTWVIITPCEAANVEEELIGRITTKFASYSTACLVAQHEGVCNEYTEIVRNIKAAQEQLALLQSILAEAHKQKESYAKVEKFDLAEKSKASVQKLEEQIKSKKVFIESETVRAEQVRSKAEAEAGPVLDMVQIMQNRVQELFHTRVKSVKDKYKVDDLELEEQLAKMSALVQRAKELASLVARPVNDIRKALDYAKKDDTDDEEEEAEAQPQTWAKFDSNKQEEATPAPVATPPPADAAPAAEPAPAVEAPAPAAPVVEEAAPAAATSPSPAESKDEDSDISDWDIDDQDLPQAFAPLEGAEVFMTVEPSTGMVTITPSKSAEMLNEQAGFKAPIGDMVMIRKTSLSAIQQAQEEKERNLKELSAKADSAMAAIHEKEMVAAELETTAKSLNAIRTELDELRARAQEAEARLAEKSGTDEQLDQTNSDLVQIRQEMSLLKLQQKQAEEQLAERDKLVENLQQAQDALYSMKEESERIKAQLASKLEEEHNSRIALENQVHSSSAEKEELALLIASRHKEAEDLKHHLEDVNQDLQNAARDALEKSARLKELQEKEFVMAQELEILKNQTEEERRAAADRQAAFDAQLKHLEANSRGLLDELQATRQAKDELEAKVQTQQMTLSELRQHLAAMAKDLAAANDDKRAREQQLEETLAKAEADKALIEKLKDQSRAEEMKRRELHNLIQEIKGNIRVYIRIRPSQGNPDDEKVYEKVLGSDDRGLKVVGASEESATGKGAVQKKWEFEFDRVFWPTNTQGEIFAEISQLVQSALDGYKVCIFAYGQTGSGKTFTMEGPPKNPDGSDAPTELRGMIPRSVEQLFNYRDQMRVKGWEYTFEVSFLEIYNTIIRDLLSQEGEDVAENKHEIRLVKKGKGNVIQVDGLTQVVVTSVDDLAPLLKKAGGARATSATASNARSSRSHSVFTLRMTGLHAESGQITDGILNLIDLAGSERVSKSEVTGQRLEETKAINTSLTCLGDVIAALAQGAKHVPYRNSKLTYLLQDCFGGGSKTLMFINVSPESAHISESLCSLRFGAKVHDCHIGVGKKAVSAAGSEEKSAAPAKAPAKTPVKKK